MPASQQRDHYARNYDYWSESPHLKHRHLYEMLLGRIVAMCGQVASDRIPQVLEIGAGDGAVTERLLAIGADVTGTEMSEHSVEAMNYRFAGNDRFRAFHDVDGSLDVLGDRQFDLIVYASVLHHIPDYLSSIAHATTTRLREGGGLASVQDPLWYPRLSPWNLRFTQACYLSWRVTQGNFARGIGTRLRRARHGLSEEAAGDVVEYHVVRDGVDELAIAELLQSEFEDVELLPYWSSQGILQQKLGEKLRLRNTFALFASGYTAPPDQPSGTSGRS